MKNLRTSLFVVLLALCFTPSFAQLVVNPIGDTKIGNEWPNNDYNNEVSVELFGLNTTNYRPGSKLSFGDYSSSATSGANVFIGEIGPGDTDALQVHGGNGIFFTQGGQGSYITAQFTGGNARFYGYLEATAFNIVSDIRLKKNVRKMSSGLPLIMQLQAITYDYKTEKEDSIINSLSAIKGTDEKEKKSISDLKTTLEKKKTNSMNQIGFSAQDVQAILPQVVNQNETGHLSVNYTALVPVLVEALKEQQKIIDDQAKTIDAQQKDIIAIKRKIGL
jgi:Chaperone of endosialidase